MSLIFLRSRRRRFTKRYQATFVFSRKVILWAYHVGTCYTYKDYLRTSIFSGENGVFWTLVFHNKGKVICLTNYISDAYKVHIWVTSSCSPDDMVIQPWMAQNLVSWQSLCRLHLRIRSAMVRRHDMGVTGIILAKIYIYILTAVESQSRAFH
jgi:hypothetical protein